MSKNVYLIIPDVHLGNISSANRINYRAEMEYVQGEMLKIAAKYKSEGYAIKTLFLGDIFHNSYKSVTEALIDYSFLQAWRNKVGECFSVIGNHELTYYKANPFYHAIRSINSESVTNIKNKVWTPLGFENVINVVDELHDGEVGFYFNHYGTGIRKCSGDNIKVGLFHQDIVDSSIINETNEKGRRLDWVKPVEIEKHSILDDYDYCFFGHMHTISGVWKTEKTFLVYLASLGRTNETEVKDDFLTRNIPGVIVKDGVFEGIEDNIIQLMPRASCIKEDVAETMREAYAEVKERSEIRHSVSASDDPILNLRSLFVESPEIIKMLDDLEYSEIDSRFNEIQDIFRRLK